MKRLRWFIILPLLLLNLGILSMAYPATVYAEDTSSVFSTPQGGYYNVPKDKLDDPDAKWDAITIPADAQQGESFVTKNFSAFFVDCANDVVNFFGLHSIDQLAKSTRYLFWGALDNNDVRIVSAVVLPFITVAWIMALISGKVFFVRLAWSSMNSRRKLRIQEFFGYWFVGALLLTFGLKIVNILFQLSSVFTDTFLGAMPNGTFNPLLISGDAKAGTGLALALFSLAVIGITFAMNFIYLQRYVMMLVYACLAPMFFTMYFYDATRERFWNWLKNLITLAFMPAVHSFMMMLYMYSSTMRDSYMLRLVFLLLFISITEVILNLGGLSAGTGGLGNHVLTGLGLGIALSGARGVGGMFAAINGGGGVEAALAMRMGMDQKNSGIGKPGAGVISSSAAGLGSNGINTAGVLSGSNPRVARTQAFKNAAMNIGSKLGSMAGGMGGAVMGAATGNMGMMSLGGVMGSSFGGKVGGATTGGVAGAGAVQGQILGQQIRGLASGNPISRDGAKEEVFGAGPNLPAELDSLRPQIAAANIAGLQGSIVPGVLRGVVPTNQNRINGNISQAMASALQPMANITPQEGDRMFSRAYADHTEFYYQPNGQSSQLVDVTSVGDRMAGMNNAIETVQEYRGRNNSQGNMDYNWQDVQRVSVDANSPMGSPGVPWTWNTRNSLMQ